MSIFGPKNLQKTSVQKVTHFYEFSGTQNVSLSGSPLYIPSKSIFWNLVWLLPKPQFPINFDLNFAQKQNYFKIREQNLLEFWMSKFESKILWNFAFKI